MDIVTDDELLDAIENLTDLGTKSAIVIFAEIKRRGIYPKPKGNTTVERMVEMYGARWHLYREPLACQFCGADLRDHKHGPPYKREISIYCKDRDRTTHYKCPECKNTWLR
jgi:hypothetical protein